MHGIAVTLLTEDKERVSVLQHRLEATNMGRNVFTHVGFPASAIDPVVRQIQDVRTEVVLVDIDSYNVQRAISAIELIHSTTSDIAIFAIGPMNDPSTIVSTMRAGAREYLELHAGSEALVEAFTRFASARGKTRTTSGRARVFTVTNAKGGAGATTVAVNTAIALQESHGGVLMTHCKGGLQLLAGPQQPHSLVPTVAEMARLFDLLVAHFRYVIVDCSGRLDQTSRMLCDLSNAVLLVAQTDVVSLWSASKIRAFLEEGSGRDRVRLVLNRYKKIPGFSDEDVAKATNCALIWKLPNNYQSIAPAIDKGAPVALHDSHDIGRSFRSLAATLADASATAEGSLDLTYRHDKADGKKKAAGRLLISPLRAGQ